MADRKNVKTIFTGDTSWSEFFAFLEAKDVVYHSCNQSHDRKTFEVLLVDRKTEKGYIGVASDIWDAATNAYERLEQERA